MTITLGWWLAPTAITLIAFIVANSKSGNSRSGGDYSFDFSGIFFNGIAIIVSLFAWVVYFGVKAV